MADLQTIIVSILVAAAFAFVVWRFCRWIRRFQTGAGCGKGGCGCAPKSPGGPLK